MSVTQVLVVDDFQPWRRIVRVMLESKNNLNVVAEAVDGLDAIQNAQQLQPDLVVLDVGLPFMVNDWPDAMRLFEMAGNLVREAAKMAKSEPPRVAICGECAPILWAQGKEEAAIQLEKLWDVVARRHDVDILCGYTLSRSENSHIFERICAEHSVAYSV